MIAAAFHNNKEFCQVLHVLTLANDTICTGPRLQMLTKDADANARIKDAFERWSRGGAIDLLGKLRTMRPHLARAESGEA